MSPMEECRQIEKRSTELLAPAGGLEAFFAALDSGADAVYCGFAEFSARAKARNFSLAELERMASYAHQYQRRLYVALNTLVKEQELPRLVDILAALAGMRVDGIIIQDLGVWRLASSYFPELPLHASTQMTIHNAAGVRMAERMGFVQAVLARELTLAEIAAIRQETTIGLEHFVHGALCFSISGQCFFSSWITGQSGNRGRCAQPCRRRYLQREEPGFHFSTSDLCAIEMLPELIRAGVSSFKIEGRMKSADYVARVVSAYRLVLDAPERERKQAVRQAGELLAQTFGREPTKGFLSGFVPAAIADPSRSGTLGKRLGEVAVLGGGMLGFTCNDRLHTGDRVRVQPQGDQASSGFSVRALQVNGRAVKVARPGDFVRIPLPEGKGFFRKGDAVFKVGGKPAFTQGPEACRARLAEVSLSPLAQSQRDDLEYRQAQAMASLLPKQTCRQPVAALSLTVVGRDQRDLSLLDTPGLSRIVLPLTPQNLAGLKGMATRLAALGRRLIWELPAMLFGVEWEEYRRGVRMLYNHGCRSFRLNNLGHLPLFAKLDNLELLGGPRCYVMNSQAGLAWQELGLHGFTANLEDDARNIVELLQRPLNYPLALTVYSPVTVLLSRIPIRLGRAGALRSESEEEFRVRTSHGLTEVTAEHAFSLLGHGRELARIGVTEVVVDLSHCGAQSKLGQQVLSAWQGDQSLPDTVNFNFQRGLL